jgi:phage terminase Nu1 subunit (DNA packaging protein)
MKRKDKLPLQRISQAELAQFLDVDRGTVRAWTLHGMPYRAPAGKGLEGTYSGSIALYWMLANKNRKAEQWPERLTPLQTIAFAYVHLTDDGDDARPTSVRRSEAKALFPNLAAEFYSKDEHLEALNYAFGFFDSRAQRRHRRGRAA